MSQLWHVSNHSNLGCSVDSYLSIATWASARLLWESLNTIRHTPLQLNMHGSWYTDKSPPFASTGMDPGTPCSLSYSPMIRDSSSHLSAAFLKIAKVISLTSLLRSLSWLLGLSPFEQFWLGIASTGLAGSLHWTTRYQGKPMLPSLAQLIPKFTGLGLLGLTGGMVNDTTMGKT